MSAPARAIPPAPHARRVTISPAERLGAQATEAAQLRAYHRDPAVVALRVEQVRAQVVTVMAIGIGLGLCFTMTSVQAFAAANTPVGSAAWWAAWLLDPMISLILLGVLRAEQLTASWQVPPGLWSRVAKWVLLAATYVMNTWASWAVGSVAGVVVHSIPPLLVLLATEALHETHHALSQCVHRAETTTGHRGPPVPQTPTPNPPVPAHEDPPGNTRNEPQPAVGAERTPPRAGERPAPRAGERPARRVLLADYVAQARAAWAPGVVVTPAWVRRVTTCSRGLSPKVAAALNTQLPTPTTPVHRDFEGKAA